MKTVFIPTTQLQRNAKKVLASKEPFQIILNNNQLEGLVVNKETAQYLLDSGTLDQIIEELWELHDEQTSTLVEKSRTHETEPISWEIFNQKHDL